MSALRIAGLVLAAWAVCSGVQAPSPGYHVIDRIAGPDGGWDSTKTAGRAGTLAVIGVVKGRSTILETVPTAVGARTIALDERTGRLYLPTARYGPAATVGGRPTTVPGAFQLLVVGK